MGRNFFVLVLAISLCISVLPVSAQENRQKVGEGHTSDGVYYEVYELQESGTENDIILYGSGIPVRIEVIFQGTITPQREFFWQESRDGDDYSGVLTLESYTCVSNKTIATYSGMLYKE